MDFTEQTLKVRIVYLAFVKEIKSGRQMRRFTKL